ncbi:hypothetical protein NDU88_005308 [Pleurodeles waltl]|uniref:Uncharacterized protein n=1 Tax=Pleurodeles waltl TaxID=8319 RepID=A0AAV7LKS6_PLEWA|nr:hypothetical protein NDU88_005308 [Pleurodeles waltl]
MAAMFAVVPLAQDVAGPLAMLAAMSVAAVLVAGSLTAVLVKGSVSRVLAAVSVAAVLVAGSLTAVLAAALVAVVLVVGSLTAVLVAGSVSWVLAVVSVATVLVAGSLMAVLVKGSGSGVLAAVSVAAVLVAGSLTAMLLKGSVSGVLAAVSVAAVQVAVPVAVLSAVQVGVDVDLPLIFRTFPTLIGGAAVVPLSFFVLTEPLVAGVLAFSFGMWATFSVLDVAECPCPRSLGHWQPCCLAHSKIPLLLAPLCLVMWWLRCWVGTWKGGP